MTAEPTLDDLVDAVVVLQDRHGRSARYVVEHVSPATVICSYVFRGRHRPEVRCEVGDEIELGTSAAAGWLLITGRVVDVKLEGMVSLHVESLRIVQRRRAYREDVIVPFTLRRVRTATTAAVTLRGRTDNLSAGGFAARIEGHPIPLEAEVGVTFQMPERDELALRAVKVGGDLQQRFAFVDLDTGSEDRLVRLVRAAELSRRRATRIIE